MKNETQPDSPVLASAITLTHQLRIEALNSAVRHRLSTETPDQLVKAAEKYFAFLQGK